MQSFPSQIPRPPAHAEICLSAWIFRWALWLESFSCLKTDVLGFLFLTVTSYRRDVCLVRAWFLKTLENSGCVYKSSFSEAYTRFLISNIYIFFNVEVFKPLLFHYCLQSDCVRVPSVTLSNTLDVCLLSQRAAKSHGVRVRLCVLGCQWLSESKLPCSFLI